MPSQAYQKLKDANVLPSPTGLVLEILRLVGDEKATLHDIGAAVESDPALAARILKLVNSSFAGVSRKVVSITDAVKLLGVRTTKNVALGLSLVSNHQGGRCRSFDYGSFWSESLARAVAARQIAACLENFPPDEAFAAGLFCKVGCLALATGYPQEYARVLDVVANGEAPELREMERQTFGIDHNELSSELMVDWRMDGLFCEAVRYQDSAETRTGEADARIFQLAQLLHLAGASALVLNEPQTHIKALAELMEEAHKLGIPQTAFTELFGLIGSEWREAGTIFSVPTREPQSLPALRATTEDTGLAGDHRRRTDIRHEPAQAGPEALHILIVDDDPVALRMLEKNLVGNGYRVTKASNGLQAMEFDRSQAPAMIITDWVMPEMDGIELCRRLRGHESSSFLYVIVLTAHSEKARVIEALNAGADDFLAKPFDREELLAHVRAGERILRLEGNLAERNREIAGYNARLLATNDTLRSMATTDELTRLANRREAMARLTEHWALAERYCEPLSCIVADIDHFKDFNDTGGHAAGDAVLRATAAVLRKTARAGEVVCRIGGEEFLIICPRSTAASAQAVAERMRLAVSSSSQSSGIEGSVTISLGVAQRTASMEHPDDLLKAADEMLYAAKRAGRNRVCMAETPVGPPDPDPQAGKAAPYRRALGDLNGLPVSVLIIGDDPVVRSLCRSLLEQEAYVVAEACNGTDPFDKVSLCSPDVIVMDCTTPDLDALECARRLKAQPNTQEIPVILLGSAKQAKDVEVALETGVDEYIAKPFGNREFTLRVRSMARLHRSKAELLWSNERRWEQARALQVLLDLSMGLVGIDNLDGILERTVAAVAELTRCQRVTILLPDAEKEYLTTARFAGVDEGSAHPVRVPIRQGIAGQVFLSGKQVVLNSRPEQEEAEGTPGGVPGPISIPFLSKPLRAKQRVVGVLNITKRNNQQPFETAELESLDLLCNVVATAIDDLMSRQERDTAQDSITLALATLAEHRDCDTGRHLDRVTRYALILADQLQDKHRSIEQIEPDLMSALHRAMPLHDIGKVAVPDHILLKPGPLTTAEMAQMRTHAEIGAQTIRSVLERMPSVRFLQIAEEIAWGHHERWDGTGYPRGLRGNDIPFSARIAAVADVYDALTTKRVYKDAVSHQEAVAIIRQGAGSQFDPAVIEAFLAQESEFACVASMLADDSCGGKAGRSPFHQGVRKGLAETITSPGAGEGRSAQRA